MTKVVYFHGLKTDPGSKDTGVLRQQLAQVFQDDFVSAAEMCGQECFDYLDFEKTKKLIDTYVLPELCTKTLPDKCIIVGNSLGGFWARYVQEATGMQTVLVNPNLTPWSHGAVSKDKFLACDYSIYAKLSYPSTRYQTAVILGYKDDLIDLDMLKSRFDPRVYWIDDGHVITKEASFNSIINRIKEMDNQVIQ